MKVTICVGSLCHLKGARQVVETLQDLIERDNLSDSVELDGSFCMGNCQKGVCVTIDDNIFSVMPSSVDEFYEKEIKAKVL